MSTTGGAQPMRLAELQQLAPQINELLGRFGASNVAVFRSVARDQANPGSDVDLLASRGDWLGCGGNKDFKAVSHRARR